MFTGEPDLDHLLSHNSPQIALNAILLLLWSAIGVKPYHGTKVSFVYVLACLTILYFLLLIVYGVVEIWAVHGVDEGDLGAGPLEMIEAFLWMNTFATFADIIDEIAQRDSFAARLIANFAYKSEKREPLNNRIMDKLVDWFC